jgi:hypothetical protein
MTDKGYDSQSQPGGGTRARHQTGYPAPREFQAERTVFPKRLYKLRARIEQAIAKLKRVAMRCEKTDTSYSAIISFACGLMLVKSVHTA